MRLRGEHDLSTAPEVRATLGSISGSVLVDLSDCAFIDSTVIGALIAVSQELEREGHVLELYVPPENRAVSRTLEVTRMGDLVVVHSTSPVARADDAAGTGTTPEPLGTSLILTNYDVRRAAPPRGTTWTPGGAA